MYKEISSKFIVELLKWSKTHKYFFDLLDDKRLLYSLIYSLELIGLEILKSYIKTNMVSSFIKFFKSYHYINTICLKK